MPAVAVIPGRNPLWPVVPYRSVTPEVAGSSPVAPGEHRVGGSSSGFLNRLRMFDSRRGMATSRTRFEYGHAGQAGPAFVVGADWSAPQRLGMFDSCRGHSQKPF